MSVTRDWVDAIDVYSQYFNAHANVNGVERKAAIVKLTCLKDIEGLLAYQISASFFPFRDPEDFVVSGDAEASEIVFEAKKRRVKKKEAELLETIREDLDKIITKLDPKAEIYWDRPLMEARMG
ncbi:MAG: hypothetical protein IJM15_00465 [Erysipelotrichaceae bacterium]|nr:hypothetical protein [Erysipelotrichaceae bacterium]